MESNNSWVWSCQQETFSLPADSQIAPVLLAVSNRGTEHRMDKKIKESVDTNSTYRGKFYLQGQ